MYLKAGCSSALKQPKGLISYSDCHVTVCHSDKGWTNCNRDTPGGGRQCCAEEPGRHHKDAYQVKAALVTRGAGQTVQEPEQANAQGDLDMHHRRDSLG